MDGKGVAAEAGWGLGSTWHNSALSSEDRGRSWGKSENHRELSVTNRDGLARAGRRRMNGPEEKEASFLSYRPKERKQRSREEAQRGERGGRAEAKWRRAEEGGKAE